MKRINIGNPGQLFLQQGEWQCIVPQTTWLEMMGNQVKWNAYLIAISHQKGKQWYFIDANLYRAKKSVKGLPALHPDMVIPTVQAPEFIPPQQ